MNTTKLSTISDRAAAVATRNVGSNSASTTVVPRGNETILLVDHDPATRDYAAWILRELGYRVIATGDGQEALCLFHQDPNRRIDLLLGDATMPRIGGKQLAHLITAFLPKSRILITSYYPAELAVHNNLLDAALSYIQKPVTRQSLAVKVREVLNFAKKQEDREAAIGQRLVFASAEELENTSVV